MAVRTENRCVDCGLHCKGIACPNRNVKVLCCDKCGEELSSDNAYCLDEMDLCEDCLKEMCKKEW